MTTTQTNGRDIKRLCWLLDTMIEHLDSAPPESALGGIEQYEDEAAELIATTGLADDAGIPAELRPVIQRKEGGHDKKGTEEFAKLVEEAGIVEKAEFPEEGFPTCVAFRFVTTDCHESIARFDWHAASGLGLGPEPDPPRGYKRVKPPPGHPLAELVSSSGPPPLEPDARYVRTLVACLKGWRALTNAPSAQEEAGSKSGQARNNDDPLDPIAKALAMKVQDPDKPIEHIAKELGIHKSKLYRDPRFARFVEASREADQHRAQEGQSKLPKGSIDASGNLEAWKD